MLVGMTRDDGISQYLKVYIEKDIPGHGLVTVVGYIGEGASMSLQSQWNPPFENDTVGDTSYMQKAGDAIQAGTGLTAKAEWNSLLNWVGIEPPQITMPIVLKAFSDAKLEVEDPIKFLKMMASPELNEISPLGRIPQPCLIDIGRKIKLIDCVIQDIQEELDSPRSKLGWRTENTVQMQFQMKQMLNQSEISNIHPN